MGDDFNVVLVGRSLAAALTPAEEPPLTMSMFLSKAHLQAARERAIDAGGCAPPVFQAIPVKDD